MATERPFKPSAALFLQALYLLDQLGHGELKRCCVQQHRVTFILQGFLPSNPPLQKLLDAGASAAPRGGPAIYKRLEFIDLIEYDEDIPALFDGG